jgi:N-acetylmuramoyl-L-alanine amidase
LPHFTGSGGPIGGLPRTLALICFVLATVLSGAAQAAAALPQVVDARVTTTPERARLIVDLSGPTQFAIVSLDGPNRVAIDVKAADSEIPGPAKVAGTGIVSDVSVALADPGRVRTTLFLSEPAQVQQAYVLDAVADQPARLVVDLIPDAPAHFALTVAADLAASRAIRQVATAAPAPRSADGPAGATKARPLVVIDPGHGGVDNGATASGVHEKNITLAFALDLEKVLLESGRFDVALTRSDDTYLTLNERVNLARENKADLFISLHADSFQERDIRGASVYTRDENATDILDKVLADSENKYDMVAGFAAPAEQTPQVMDILLDLLRREMRKSSYLAAESIVDALQSKVPLRRFPVRKADFFVLQAPDIPSVLVELGFLSNPEDVANLGKTEWRDKTVEAIAKGIGAFFDTQQQQIAAVGQ